jgi:hypothetical protein
VAQIRNHFALSTKDVCGSSKVVEDFHGHIVVSSETVEYRFNYVGFISGEDTASILFWYDYQTQDKETRQDVHRCVCEGCIWNWVYDENEGKEYIWWGPLSEVKHSWLPGTKQ